MPKNSCARHGPENIGMKNIISVFSMSVVICVFIACGNSKAPATEQVATESEEKVEEADSAAIDIRVVATRGGSESEGLGSCGESGYNYKVVSGRGDTCGNCGHAYKRQY